MQKGVDRIVLQQCLEGDERGFNVLYQSLFSFLMNICIRYNRDYDEAGLALNEIFLKITNRLSDFNQDRPFLPWVKSIAINHLIDSYRSRTKSRQLNVVDDELKTDDSIFELGADSALRADDLIKMIRELSDPMGHVFNLYAIDGFQHREIAVMLNIPENTSKWYVAKARKELQAKLMKEEEKVTMSK